MYEVLIINKITFDRRFAYTRNLNSLELSENEIIDFWEYID